MTQVFQIGQVQRTGPRQSDRVPFTKEDVTPDEGHPGCDPGPPATPNNRFGKSALLVDDHVAQVTDAINVDSGLIPPLQGT